MAVGMPLYEMLFVMCLLLTGLSPVLGYTVATAADAVPSPTQAGTKYPELSQVISSLKMFSPELVAYLDNPKTVCTVITPTNKAMSNVLDALGEYVGLVLQNQTMLDMILSHQIIPGQRLKAEDMGTKVKVVDSKQGEPLYFVQHGGVPYVAYGREYVEPIEVANIKAGGCIVHIVGQMIMAPPSGQPAFVEYLAKAGNASALQAPKSLWLTDLPAVNGSAATAAPAAVAAEASPAGAQPTDSRSAPAAPGSQQSAAQRPQSHMFAVGAAGSILMFITYAASALLFLG